MTGDNQSVPRRCTQNLTMGEEWRKGWHPESIAPTQSKDTVLVGGTGPSTRVGGRLIFDAALPGLATWMRVADHRMLQIQKMANVNLYLKCLRWIPCRSNGRWCTSS